MSRALFLSLVAVILTVLPSKARAWREDGHRIVCAMAWDELQPGVRKKIQGILDIKSREQFADLCNWADEYRTTHSETAPWHFVDLPLGATSVDTARDCPDPKSCVVIQIDRQLSVLESSAPKEDRATALKFIGHFVGDIHQPLHAGFADDRGGNRIRGEFMGQKMDMHEIWDKALIDSEKRPWPELARNLRRKVTAQKRRAWSQSQPIAWANESLAIDLAPRTKYNAQSKGFVWGADYARENVPVANQRLSQAGVRLGHLLNVALQ